MGREDNAVQRFNEHEVAPLSLEAQIDSILENQVTIWESWDDIPFESLSRIIQAHNSGGIRPFGEFIKWFKKQLSLGWQDEPRQERGEEQDTLGTSLKSGFFKPPLQQPEPTVPRSLRIPIFLNTYALGIGVVGDVIIERLENGTLELDSAYIRALFDPDNVQSLSTGYDTIRQILIGIAISGINPAEGEVDPDIEAWARTIYGELRLPDDEPTLYFFGRNAAIGTDCANTCSVEINLGHRIPQAPPSGNQLETWRVGRSGFVSSEQFLQYFEGYINSPEVSSIIDVTASQRQIPEGEDDHLDTVFTGTQVGDVITWRLNDESRATHTATIVGFQAGNTYYLTYNEARNHHSPDNIIPLISDNQTTGIRPYTDVLTEDAPITHILEFEGN